MRLPWRRTDDERSLAPAAGTTWPASTFAPHSAAGVNPRNATTLGDVYACIRVLSDAAASLPLVAYRRLPDGGRLRYDGSSVARLIREPSPGFTTANFVGQIVTHLNLWGNAYIGKYRDAEGLVIALRLLAPERMTVTFVDGEPRYTWSDERGRQLHLTGADVCHVRGMTTDGLLGLSPIRQCAVALGLSRRLVDHAVSFFEEGAHPSIVINLGDSRPNKEQREEFRQDWGSRNKAGRRAVGLLWGGASIDPSYAVPMDDLQFVEQRKLSSTEIARIFRVPPSMIAAESGSSLKYTNVQMEQIAFVTHSLRPWLVCIEQAISIDPDLSPTTVYVEFLLDALLRADTKERAESYALALDPDKGWMTRDEVRRLENLDPDPTTPPGGTTA